MTLFNAFLCSFFIAVALPANAGSEHDYHHREHTADNAPSQAPESLLSEELGGGIHVIYGEGGNVGVFTGEKGVFLIDNKLTHTVTQVQRAVAALSDQPVKFIVNTHHHFDHTGGNEAFGEDGAVIIAHKNVRKRLSEDYVVKAFNKSVPATQEIGLPVVTFTEDLTMHLEGHTVTVKHFSNAHTDGDAAVFFEEENIVHTGDLFFNGFYPFIDVDGGGSLRGLIAAQTAILARIDDNTAVIPGHGPLATRDELTATRDMLSAYYDNVLGLVSQGKNREDTIKAAPGAAFDPVYGDGFLAPGIFAGIVYDSIIADNAPSANNNAHTE